MTAALPRRERAEPADDETAAAPPEPAGSVLLTAAWFGALTGLAEVVLRLVVQKGLLGKRLFFGPHFLWMAPAADAALFVLVALALVAAGRLRRDALSPRVVLFAFSFLAALSVLCLYPGLHRLAAALLAAGAALHASRLLARRAAGLERFVRRTAGAVAALLLVLAAGVYGSQTLRERRADRGLPAVRAGAPNVLLIVLDTVRAQSLGLYGREHATSPRLDRWAQGGAVFEQAIATAPWTPPSHASMFTGRFPHELLEKWDAPLGDEYPTLAEALSERGYRTAGFVANVEYAGYEQGLDRGFARYEDFPVSLPELALSSALGQAVVHTGWVRRAAGFHDIPGRRRAADVNRAFLRWLDRRAGPDRGATRKDDASEGGERPFFVFLNYYEAHEPYLPPPPYEGMFGSPAPRRHELLKHWKHQAKRLKKRQMTARQVQAELDAYEASIAWLDGELGRLLSELHARGVLERTLVVVTSDHGEQFGEHGLFTHANSLYRQVLHVPLILALPGSVPAGKRVREPVSLRDIPATVMDLALGDGGAFPGRSLARAWRAEGDLRGTLADTLLSEFGGESRLPASSIRKQKSIHASGLHYILRGNGKEEAYDFVADPLERRPIDPAGPRGEQVAPLRSFLAGMLNRGPAALVRAQAP